MECGARLEVVRPGICRCKIFSSATFRRRQRLRRDEFRRQQSRSDFTKTERRDQGAHSGVSGGKWFERNRAGAGGRGHRIGQRPRSAHQFAKRRTANPRVVKARGVAEEKVRELIRQNTNGRDFGVFGEPGVNVLQLNRALDQLH